MSLFLRARLSVMVRRIWHKTLLFLTDLVFFRPGFSRFLEWSGQFWGDQRDGFICNNGHFFDREYPDDDDGFETCPECGGEIFAKVAHGLLLSLRWYSWHTKWFPHRTYSWMRAGGDVKRWHAPRVFGDRVLWEKPYKHQLGGE